MLRIEKWFQDKFRVNLLNGLIHKKYSKFKAFTGIDLLFYFFRLSIIFFFAASSLLRFFSDSSSVSTNFRLVRSVPLNALPCDIRASCLVWLVSDSTLLKNKFFILFFCQKQRYLLMRVINMSQLMHYILFL